MQDGTLSKGLRTFAALTAAMVVVLILAGGLVTTTETGDTIPTWPHWRGKLHGGMWVEMSHRFLGGLVGLMALGLALGVTVRDRRPAVRWLAWASFAGVTLQGLLGALRVLFSEAGPSQAVTAVIHAVFAQLVFCGFIATALSFSRAWTAVRPVSEAAGVGAAATVAAFLQLVVGAVARHTGIGLEVHVAGGILVLVLAAVFVSRLLLTPLHKGGVILASILVGQVLLGILTWALTRTGGFSRSTAAPAGTLVLVSAHVALGAGLLAGLLVTTLLCARRAPRLEASLA